MPQEDSNKTLELSTTLRKKFYGADGTEYSKEELEESLDSINLKLNEALCYGSDDNFEFPITFTRVEMRLMQLILELD